jgi:hypothetical protein
MRVAVLLYIVGGLIFVGVTLAQEPETRNEPAPKKEQPRASIPELPPEAKARVTELESRIKELEAKGLEGEDRPAQDAAL